MNLAHRRPVIAVATVAGILLAAYAVVLDAGAFDWLADDAVKSLTILVGLVVPVAAAFIAERWTTSLASPNLPVGTVVNAESDAPTSTVTKDA